MEQFSVVELKAMFDHAIAVIKVYQTDVNNSNLVDEFAGYAELLDLEIRRRIRLACKQH